MNYLQVKDWDEHQSYRKDRGTPPWIKIHRRLMTNPKWAELTDSEKGQLVSLWIASADKNGLVPTDPKILRKICMLDELPNINKFIGLGFLLPTCKPVDNQTTTKRQPNDAPETETETYTETDKRSCAPNGSRFNEWYAQYPKKKGKAEALKTWKRKKLDAQADTIIADTIKRAEIEWTDSQFIPMASTYINQQRWQDEDCAPSNGTRKSKVEQAGEIAHRAIMAMGGYDDLPF